LARLVVPADAKQSSVQRVRPDVERSAAAPALAVAAALPANSATSLSPPLSPAATTGRASAQSAAALLRALQVAAALPNWRALAAPRPAWAQLRNESAVRSRDSEVVAAETAAAALSGVSAVWASERQVENRSSHALE
jgi:hypothetical protein